MADGFKDRYEEHMSGRNGADALARVCLVVALLLVLLSFAVVGVGPFLYVLVLVVGIALAAYAVLRMNSRDIAARKAENDAFVGLFHRSGSGAAQPRERRERTSRARAEREDRAQEDAEEPAADEQPEERDMPEDQPQDQPKAASEKVTITCESCGQRLSVPAGKGNIRITCPKCQNRFATHT